MKTRIVLLGLSCIEETLEIDLRQWPPPGKWVRPREEMLHPSLPTIRVHREYTLVNFSTQPTGKPDDPREVIYKFNYKEKILDVD